MKKIVGILGVLLVGVVVCLGDDITISWDMNLSNERVDKYIVYQASSRNGYVYSKLVEVAGTTNRVIVKNLVGGVVYKYKVTARNVVGESNPSVEVSYYRRRII